MYYAVNQDVSGTEAYRGFLCDILKNSNSYYESIFKRIVQEAQSLAKSNDYYSIDSDRFSIVSFFAQFDEIVNSMDADNLTREDFEALLKCFEYQHDC